MRLSYARWFRRPTPMCVSGVISGTPPPATFQSWLSGPSVPRGYARCAGVGGYGPLLAACMHATNMLSGLGPLGI